MIRRNSFRSGSLGASQKVTIRLLDDNEVIQVDFQPHHKGQFLMDYVCRQLNIAEKDYFGLRYVDSTKQRHWLDLGKSILKQLKEMTPFIICFRFKFYPGDPMLLKEEVTRYQLVLQLRRDLLHGRLHSPNHSDIATLSSYIVQSELGDYDVEVNTGNYVSEYELVARQSAELEEKVKDLHSKLKGVTPAEADILFLKKAATLDTYGVDPHPVKEQGEQLFLGINHSGISTFQGSKRLTHFKWLQITKLNYEAKMFIVHISVSEDSRNRKKETAGFKCQTSKACKYLWRCAVEQRLFFTCPSAQEVTAVRGGGLFGSRFRYSGKVQKEILEDPGPLRAIDGVLQRTPLYRSLQRNKTRSLSQSPMQLGYGSLPRSNHSAPSNDVRMDTALGDIGSSSSLPLSTLSTPFGPDHGISLLETLEEDSSPVEESDLMPSFDFEHPPKDCDLSLGDIDTLRESKINEIETPTSCSMPQSGPFVSGPMPKGKDSNSNQGQIILSIWKIFIVCMVCVLIALIFVAILAIEVDIDICQKMRRIPEIEFFQTGFYEPVKYFIRDKIHNISDNINLTFQ